MKTIATAALAATMALATAAEAATLNFSYLLDTGRVAAGSVDGDLAGDGNRFVVTGVNDFTVDGVSVTESYDFDSADVGYAIDPAAVPTLSLDGSYLDFLLFRGATPLFVLGVGNGANAVAVTNFGPQFASGLVGAQVAFGGDGQFAPFVAANYSASLAVPEPATWGLMILGFGAVGGVLRRRRSATQVAVRFG